MKKYRYEFPPLEPHFVEAPTPRAVIAFIKRTFPHNFDEVLPTLVEVPCWPAVSPEVAWKFWKTLDDHGRVLPRG